MNTNAKAMNFVIKYCGGWGYGGRFNMAKQTIMSKCPNATVTGQRANGKTGEFEVILNGKLIHSKLETGKMPEMDGVLKDCC